MIFPRKRHWLTWGLVLTSIGCTALWQRVAIQRVRFHLNSVRLKNPSLQGATLRLHWQAYNPNGITAVLDGFEVDVYANDQHVTRVNLDRPVEIAPHDSTAFHMDVPITWSLLGNTLTQLFRERRLEIKADGRALMKTPWGTLRIPVMQKTRRIL